MMIKNIFFLPFVLVVLSFSTQALCAENFLFLSYEQFENLTSSEQMKYIGQIRTLTIQFDEAGDLAPKINSQNSSMWLFISTFENLAYANYDVTSSKISSSDIREENAKISVMFDFLSGQIRSARDLSSPVLKQHASETFLSVYDRIKKLSQKSMTTEQKQNFDKNISHFKESYSSILSLNPDLQNLKSDISKLGAVSSLTSKASSPQVDPSGVAIPGLKKNPTTKKETSSSATQIKLTPTTKASPRCLYAGFVIANTSSCSPKTELEKEERLEELTNSDFKCKTTNQILCNPLVFGYQNDLSPYCITRSKTASKNCQDLSNNTENHNRIHKAWKNSANKKVFDDYQNSLKSLCDSDTKNEDILSTCKIVVAQFNEKVKKEFPALLAQGKPSDTSKTDKSLKKN